MTTSVIAREFLMNLYSLLSLKHKFICVCFRDVICFCFKQSFFMKLLTCDDQGALFNCVYSLYTCIFDWNIQGSYSVTCRCKCIITAVRRFIVPFYRKHFVVLLLDELLMLIDTDVHCFY